MAWLLCAAFLGGLSRGFSGFGAALIFVPLASVALGPQQAAPLMLLIDVIAWVTLTPGAWAIADRREVGWLGIGALLGTPVGAAILLAFDAVTLRWGVTLVVLAMLALVASGWRFRGRPATPLTVGVGAVSGVLGGVAMISGPPLIAYLLGREATARQVRASFTLYLALAGLIAAVAYAASGLLTMALLGPWLLAAPAYLLGTWGGSRMFGLASERAFRIACYAMIAAAAIISMPVWDGVLR